MQGLFGYSGAPPQNVFVVPYGAYHETVPAEIATYYKNVDAHILSALQQLLAEALTGPYAEEARALHQKMVCATSGDLLTGTVYKAVIQHMDHDIAQDTDAPRLLFFGGLNLHGTFCFLEGPWKERYKESDINECWTVRWLCNLVHPKMKLDDPTKAHRSVTDVLYALLTAWVHFRTLLWLGLTNDDEADAPIVSVGGVPYGPAVHTTEFFEKQYPLQLEKWLPLSELDMTTFFANDNATCAPNLSPGVCEGGNIDPVNDLYLMLKPLLTMGIILQGAGLAEKYGNGDMIFLFNKVAMMSYAAHGKVHYVPETLLQSLRVMSVANSRVAHLLVHNTTVSEHRGARHLWLDKRNEQLICVAKQLGISWALGVWGMCVV
jgi:hypothetical protein